MNRLFKNKRGATAVEFALVAPVVLVMFMASIEVGRAMWIKSSMQYAVEEATRHVMVNTSNCNSTAETYAAAEIVGFDSSTVTFTATESTSGSFTFCEVSATYTYTVIAPLVPFSANFSAKSKVATGTT